MHAVAGDHAARRQRVGDAVHLRGEFGEGPAHAVAQHREAVAAAFGDVPVDQLDGAVQPSG